MGITPKQKQLLEFITEFREKNGYAPSQHEIARHFGFKSLGTVQNYLVRLERHGLLRKTWNARRSAEPLEHSQPLHSNTFQASESVPLPLVGRVAAGRPIEAVQANETIEVPSSMLKKRAEHFVLKVKGDSMIDQGILDGDYAVIRKQATAENGQTVVALINNEATIKKIFMKKHAATVELHAANPNYKPIIVQADETFKIEGILAGVIRLMKS